LLATAVISPSLAQDMFTVGGPNCIAGTPGQVINIPVFVRDVSGTPVGVDKPLGNLIDAFGFQVIPTPVEAIATDASGNLAATVTSAGITAQLTPVFELNIHGATEFAYIVDYPHNSLPFVSNAPAPGNQVANIQL